MKTLAATLGYSILMDDEDFEWASKFKWYAHNCGGRGRAEKRPARRTSVAEGRNVIFFVHHVITAPKGMVVDHINGDPWDNRRENLRVCTHAQNLRNRAKHGGSCSNPFKGVYPMGGRFRAAISYEGATSPLGSYGSAEDAAAAYDAAALWLHGEFARLNFPDAGTVARDPAEIFAAHEPAHRGIDEAVRVQAVARIRDGRAALHVAAELGLSTSTVTRWAAQENISLRRGRPRLAA